MKKIIKYTFAIIAIIILVLILLLLITYIANQYQNKNEFVISFCSSIMAINAVFTLFDHIFPKKNKELEELIKIKEEIKNKKEDVNKKFDKIDERINRVSYDIHIIANKNNMKVRKVKPGRLK